MQIVYFANPSEMRAWLEQNHASAQEVYVGFYKKDAPQHGITYSEALDEALCFGWIDGVRRSVDPYSYCNRFTPRRPGSLWSKVNVARVEALTAQGRMTPAGLEVFERRDPSLTEYHFETIRTLDDESQAQFAAADPAAWAFFQAQSEAYQRMASGYVLSAKRAETRQKRLGELIQASADGRRLFR